jgi:hypothetical protein
MLAMISIRSLKSHLPARLERFAYLATFRALFNFVRDVLIGLRPIYIPLSLSISSALLLWLPEQCQEIYRAIAQDISFAESDFLQIFLAYREIALSVAGIFLMGFTFWYVAWRLASTSSHATPISAAASMTCIATRALLPALPALGAAGGIWLAKASSVTPDATKLTILDWIREDYSSLSDDIWKILSSRLEAQIDGVSGLMWIILIILLCSSAALTIVALSIELLWSKQKADWPSNLHFLDKKQRYLLYAVLLISIGSVYFFPVYVSQLSGVVFIFSLFMIILALVLGQLRFWSERIRFPLVATVIAIGISCEWYNLNDEHLIRTLPANPVTTMAAPNTAPQADDQFLRWLDARVDHAIYRERGIPYPVYVIAAEGGGMYAAYHAASFLGALQDQCPSFAHHVFAISSVSGGTLGAAFFTAVASQALDDGAVSALMTTPCEPDTSAPAKPGEMDRGAGRLFDRLADTEFGYDFLSPLFAGLLFTDFAQRFIPYPIPSFDRSRSLELAFEDAWDDTLEKLKKKFPQNWIGKTNILRNRYIAHWSTDGSSPALIFNTTEVATGKRRIISPFLFAGDKLNILPIWNEPWAKELSDDMLARNVSLSTAAVLSARFPWVTPAAWFYDAEIRGQTRDALNRDNEAKIKFNQVQLVDGGYFDNSGVLTALDLIRAFRDVKDKDAFQIHLIVLTSTDSHDSSPSHETELLAPVHALLEARVASGRAIVDEALQNFGKSDTSSPISRRDGAGPDTIRKVELRDVGYALPLGWRLSQVTRVLMRAQGGDRRLCQKEVGSRPPESSAAPACTAEIVYRQLSGVTR